MPSLEQTETPNKHGNLPPRGCTLPSDSRLPQVATDNAGKGSYEAAFLVDTDEHDLYRTFTATVGSFVTLKAWFSYRLRTQAIKDGFLKQNALLDLPTRMLDWQAVWVLLQERGPLWTEQHKKQENLIKIFTQDETKAEEVLEIKSILEEIKRDTIESGAVAARS